MSDSRLRWVFCSSVALSLCCGCHSYRPPDRREPLVRTAPLERGRELYSMYCASCHDPGAPPPPGYLRPAPTFTDGVFKYGDSVDAITKIILDGTESKLMPAWRAIISEPEARSIAEHVRTLAHK